MWLVVLLINIFEKALSGLASCSTLQFMVKSQKGKKNRKKKIYPHILSRGWYDKLDNTLIKERKNKENMSWKILL